MVLETCKMATQHNIISAVQDFSQDLGNTILYKHNI